MNNDGLDDYVFLASDGALTLYVNGGKQPNNHWGWIPVNGGKEIANGAGAKREQIRLADLTGNGRADFVIVDDLTGALTLYKNEGIQPNGNWGWVPTGSIASGIGPGKGVRLADMDGDSKADYVWMSETGAMTLYLNKGEKPGGWNWVPYNPGGVIAGGVGATRKSS